MNMTNVVTLEQYYKTPKTPKASVYTRTNGAAPKARMQRRNPDVWEWDYAHSVYVNYTGKHYEALKCTTLELKTLRDFVLQQDRLLSMKRGRNGGFGKPVAKVGKVHPSTPDYADGKRWQYTTGRGASFCKESFATLKEMLAALGAALA